ncbi:MAG: TrbG/VirB9 family P-type conjugative transfer protein [Sphingomicrobium sp.]|nr:TrbG/VirB9 family P-type conjugative transfer protein [Sphingomonadales bacterium]
MSKMLAAAALVAASLGFAGSAAADPRVASQFYEPGRIVTIHGGTGIQSTIAFGPDERIENVAVGNSLAWQVTPNRRADLLFIKPLSARARTNMTVVTDQRTYLFDLVSGGAGGAVYLLRFTYPNEPKRTAPVVAAANASAVQPVAAVAARPDPALLNFNWAAGGTRALLPTRFFDDGRATYLAWPAETSLPAILVRDASGSEGPVNYSVQGDYIVIEGVPAQLVLRSGKKMATLTPALRRAPRARAPGPADPATASAAPREKTKS